MHGSAILEQLETQRRSVDTETYDIIVRQLGEMLKSRILDIAPDYQRHFVWDDHRQSELIESIYLGIPMPNIFVAENKSGSLEVIDGVQRLSTIAHFIGDDDILKIANRDKPLELVGLAKLSEFNGATYQSLPLAVQQRFLNRSIRFTSLNDKTDFDVRYDLFQRLNTGGVALTPQEIRNCVFRGEFRDQIARLAQSADLRMAVVLKKGAGPSEYEDLVLRFFAYADRYDSFESSVTGFLNSFMKERMFAGVSLADENVFNETMDFLAKAFPSGIKRRSGRTPINLFEALSVGIALIIKGGKNPDMAAVQGMLEDQGLEKYWAGGGTNSRAMVKGRIEYVRDHC